MAKQVEPYEICWKGTVVGLFYQKTSDISMMGGIFEPSKEELASEFEAIARTIDHLLTVKAVLTLDPNSILGVGGLGVPVVLKQAGRVGPLHGLVLGLDTVKTIKEPNELAIMCFRTKPHLQWLIDHTPA
ncbi:MAG TPA: hypothetical protein PK760_03270 [Flavobacteriales bacterium]|nr:hypothetical protein [Flavobacteriales bacterium]